MFDRPKLLELDDIPQSDVGAPLPTIVSSELSLAIIYRINEPDDDWDGKSVRVVGLDTPDEPCAVLKFAPYHWFQFGGPDDESLYGHPYYDLGLQYYTFHELKHSPTIPELIKANSLSPNLRARGLRHFILVFHDSTIEVVATNYSWTVKKGSIAEIAQQVATELVG